MNPNATHDTRESLASDLEAVMGEAEQLIKTVAGASSDTAAGLRATLDARIADATERLERLRAGVADQAAATAQATHRYVRENPWRAVGIGAATAALAGVVLGAWITRRRP